jgi:Phenylpropionate dioxygenase and related ring-hydroxylating dioxygenases, large terminal subunit
MRRDPRTGHTALPIPFGWFFVSYADELAIGDVKPLEYFGKELVLFRNRSGSAGLLDAYCPHLGAHLGHGGKVDGDSVRCPFHSWAFDRTGLCTDIPYAKAIPAKIASKPCLRSYPVAEKNNVIWAWFHPHEREPLFDVMENSEVDSADWRELGRFHWRLRGTVQEFNENGIDVAHFPIVHGIEAPRTGEIIHDRHIRITKYMIDQLSNRDADKLHAVVVQNGAGQQFTRISRGGVPNLNLTYVTPVNEDEIEVRFAFFMERKYAEDSIEAKVGMLLADGTAGLQGVQGDMRIWANKIHRANPILCDGDGPIMRYRRYFEQFYSCAEASVPTSSSESESALEPPNRAA